MIWRGITLENAEQMVTCFTLLETADEKAGFLRALARDYNEAIADWDKAVDMAAGRLLIGLTTYELHMGFNFDLARGSIASVKDLVKMTPNGA